MKKQVIVIVATAIAALVVLMLVSRPKSHGVNMLQVGQQAPEWTLREAGGGPVTLSQLIDNKGVVLVFFATWCPICMEEVPQLISFQYTYDKRGVSMVAINVQQPERTVQDFIKEKGVNYKVLLDETGSISAKYGVEVTGLPLIAGIDSGGIVRYLGSALPKDLDAFVASLAPGVAARDTSSTQ